MARFQRKKGCDQVVRRHALNRHRGARGIVHSFRQLHEPVRGDSDILCVRRTYLRVTPVLTDGDARYTFADRNDFSGPFLSGDPGQGHVVRAAAFVRVDEVDAACAETEDNLAGAGFGFGDVLVAQHLRAAEFMEPDCFHVAPPWVDAIADERATVCHPAPLRAIGQGRSRILPSLRSIVRSFHLVLTSQLCRRNMRRRSAVTTASVSIVAEPRAAALR